MEVFSVLVTGANRGIGLEFVKQLVELPKPPSFVFCTYRSSEKLQQLTKIKNSSKISEVVLIKMDVNIQEDIVAARKIIEEAVGDNGLTLLINNAGVAKRTPFPEITEENLDLQFKTNAVSPIIVLQEMLPLLQKSASRGSFSNELHVSRAAVLNLSSLAGSISISGSNHDLVQAYIGYRMSKATLNMGMRVIASNIKGQGILVILMCPGWVKTEMGGDQAQITPQDSISAILETLPKLNESHHGSYMDRFGNPYPF